MRAMIGKSIVVLCCSRITLWRPAKSALEIRLNQPSPMAWTARRDDLVVTRHHADHLRCACTETRWPRKKVGSHEEGLQPDLEGGDRTGLFGESGFEMSEGKFGRLLGSNLRRLAQLA